MDCKKCAKFNGYIHGYCSVCSKDPEVQEIIKNLTKPQEEEGEMEGKEAPPKCRQCHEFYGNFDGLCSQCSGVTKATPPSSCDRVFREIREKYILKDNHFQRLKKVFETNKFKFSSKDCHKALEECENVDPYLSSEQAKAFLNIFKDSVERNVFWKYEHVFAHHVLDYWNVEGDFGTGYCYYSMGRKKPNSEEELLAAIEKSQQFYRDQYTSFF